MKPRYAIVLLLAMLLVSLLPALPARAEPLCFPEAPSITHCIDGRLRSFWEQQGGLPVFGYPIGPATQQQTDNGTITFQVFERNRLEWHPNNAPPYDVLLGRLGADALDRQGYLPAPTEQPQPGCRYFSETGRNVCPPFLDTWRSYGLELGEPGVSENESIALLGLPISPPLAMTLSNGQQHTVQWFERARLEDHGNQGVQLGLLGREIYGSSTLGGSTPARAGSGNVSISVTPAIQEGVSQEPGGFIQVSGDRLVRFGQEVRIKGVNYYPQWRPWDEMWTRWDSVQMQRELQLGRDLLGINAVRILVPYDVRGDGHVDEVLIRRVQEFLQIAGDLDMRVIITLFDFYNGFPAENDRSWRKNVNYVQQFVGNFVGDERIMAWDLHNEPDHYDAWKDGNAQRVLGWLGRMADEVHRIAPNHLVTVGMGQYINLYAQGPDGRRPIDYSDVISWHNYNAPDTARQLDELQSRTGKPILLQEFGWPTGPKCTESVITEAQQAAVYREMLTAAEGRVAGIFAWTLRDYDAGPTMRWDTHEEHYGLFRPDDTLKPAAEVFAAYAAAPLPVKTRTNLELTERGERFEGEKTPILIPESGHYVKSWYRRAWEQLGDRGSFGLPLSEAHQRRGSDEVLQYFETAVLRLDMGGIYHPDFERMPEQLQTMQVVQPEPIGRIYAEQMGLTFPPQPPVPPGPNAVLVERTGYVIQGAFLDFYYNFLGEWRLGAPISPEMLVNINGVDVTVQYFEKGRLDFNPEYNIVTFGPLGRELWDMQCRQ